MITNEKVLEKIEKRIYKSPNGCWIWMGSLNASGRPQIMFDERHKGGKAITVFPHIFLYELEHGDVDSRYFDNICGEPRCCNPEHNEPRTLESRMKNYIVNENGCWIWQGHTFPETGYGSITIGGKTYSTHRAAYFLAYGEIPEGLMVLHNCNERLCIRPDHLRLGTHVDNMKDMVAANRSTRGEKNANSILAESDVIEIKKLIRSKIVTFRQIAKQFGVSRSAIKDIASGRTWSWVEE